MLGFVEMSLDGALEARNVAEAMKVLLLVVGWCLLLALNWWLALAALLLFPLLWLLFLPLRLIGIVVEAIFTLVRTILFLPARILGWRRN
jgi:hypothetical protein